MPRTTASLSSDGAPATQARQGLQNCQVTAKSRAERRVHCVREPSPTRCHAPKELIRLKQNLMVSIWIANPHQLHAFGVSSESVVLPPMSNTSVKVKVAIALFMVLATPAASFARGGGGRGGGAAAMGGSRPNAALGAQIGAAGNLGHPRKVGTPSTVSPPPPLRISVPT